MKRFTVLLITICLLRVPTVFSQAPQCWSSAEMYQALRKLNVLGSALYVAAHPDDENTRLITYLSKDRLVRTGYLSLTRGDGGQNLIGDEQGIELGLIRTQELLAARRTDGGEQFFSRAFDFGFSKGPEETFSKWDREKILSDVVWVIRKFQPDVIITRFPTTGEGGHGHHTASAILANEAFTAAADPKRFPEQLKYVKTWQAKRILFNSFNFGNMDLTAPDQFKVDVGGYNPLLGKSYGEIAAESRSNHKSQGFGAAASRGESFEFLKTTGGTAPQNDLFDGVVLTWDRVPGASAISASIDKLITSFDLLHPERTVEGLVQLQKQISALPEGYWRSQKLKEVQELIAQCSGLFLDATTPFATATQTDTVRINFSFNNRMGADIVLRRVQVDQFDSTLSVKMERNQNILFSKRLYVTATKPYTQPYWLEEDMAEGYFHVKDPLKIGQPDVDPAYNAIVEVSVYGQPFTFTRPVRHKFTDPVKGELYEPMVVLPPVELAFVNENNLSVNDSAIDVRAYFKTNLKDSAYYDMAFAHSDKWNASRDRFTYGTNGNGMNYVLSRFVPSKSADMEIIRLSAKSKSGVHYNGLRHTIHYDHIPDIVYYKKAQARLIPVNLKTAGKRIGYIVGAGDKVPQALELMGYEVTLLTEKELARNDLSRFDAILTGVRAYNTNTWMNDYYDKLMEYVREGGNLIVQYNTSSQIGPVRAKIGPYPFNISRTRVTDETAAVKFLQPDHAVLNFPNKIGEADFKGWIQERSIYHGSNWDAEFTPILSMADPGEKDDAGSLLIAPYGKGYFTYTGLVFFRELPAGVPGAYRLMANIIALNQKKGF